MDAEIEVVDEVVVASEVVVVVRHGSVVSDSSSASQNGSVVVVVVRSAPRTLPVKGFGATKLPESTPSSARCM